MTNDEALADVVQAVSAQVEAYEARERSRVEKRYGAVMRESALALAEFTRTASFEEIFAVEKTLQQNDLAIYAKLPSTLKTVQQGIDDFSDGEGVYQQLLTAPESYKAHKYREKERVAPDRLVPLDAMRRALRGQAKRVENYRKNVMGNPHEYEFMAARIAMIHRAEKLYDALQRERLLPHASPPPSLFPSFF